MHNLTQSELEALNYANTAKQWNGTCDIIKEARGGQYPPDWFQKVLLSGLLASKGF